MAQPEASDPLVRHYLTTAQAMGVAEARRSGQKTVAAMKARPTSDDAFGEAAIREDGQMIVPVYLFQAKAPEESRGLEDLFKTIATIPAAEAFRPLLEGGCPMV